VRRTCPIWQAEASSRGVAPRPLAPLHLLAPSGLTGHGQAAYHAGQNLDYLLRLQRGFKAKTMTPATQPLTETEIVNLVNFIASLGAAP
jgi:hypothetical protein